MASLTPWSVAPLIGMSASRRRRRGTAALPGVEAEVMVVAAGADERRLVSVALGDVEAEHVAVETERTVDVRHLQMDMPNVHARIDRPGHPPSLRAGALSGRSGPFNPAKLSAARAAGNAFTRPDMRIVASI